MTVPKRATIMSTMRPTEREKFRERKVRRSRSAGSCRCNRICRNTNIRMLITPIVSDTIIGILSLDLSPTDSPMRLKPYTSPPNRSAESTTDSGSSGLDRVSLTFATHHLPAVSRSHEGHDRHHHEWHHDCRAARLNDSCSEQHLKAGGERGEQSADREERHRENKHRMGRQLLQQEPGDGDNNRHRQHGSGGEKLRSRQINGEVSDQARTAASSAAAVAGLAAVKVPGSPATVGSNSGISDVLAVGVGSPAGF